MLPLFPSSIERPAEFERPPEYTADDFENLVHVARDAGTVPVHRVINGAKYRVEAAVAGVGVGIAVVMSVAWFAPGWEVLVWVGVIALTGLGLARVWHRRRIRPLPADIVHRLAQLPDNRFRLRLAAAPSVADYFRDLGDASFEPRVYRSLSGAAGIGRVRRAALTVTFVAMVGALVFTARVTVGPVGGWHTYLVIASLCPSAAVLTSLSWPTYFRVVPGRLDVIAYGFLGIGRPRVMRLDLRSSRLLVDANHDRVLIDTPGRALLAVMTAGIPDRLDFARSVLEAARCRQPPPALPDDELVG